MTLSQNNNELLMIMYTLYTISEDDFVLIYYHVSASQTPDREILLNIVLSLAFPSTSDIVYKWKQQFNMMSIFFYTCNFTCIP